MPMPTTFPAARPSSPFASMKGDHAAVRVPDFDAAIAWFQQKLDFRLMVTWPFGDLTLAYVAPPVDASFKIEIIAGAGAVERKPYTDVVDSLGLGGWHHVCFMVESADKTVEELRRRGVKIVAEPFDLPDISRRLALFCDPWGNLYEVAQVTAG